MKVRSPTLGELDTGHHIKPRIAVLLASYNGVRWLPAQITSILEQENVDVQIFVSDDGSTDGTAEWLATLARAEPQIQLLPRTDARRGLGGNFLHLLTHAQLDGFDAVAFADQDDIWFLNKLSRHFDLLQANDVAAVSSNVTAVWANGASRLICKSQPQRAFDYIFEAPGPGCTFLLRPSLVQELRQLFAGVLRDAANFPYHDWLIYALARTRGYGWLIDQQASVFYRQHASNVLGANQGPVSALRRLRVIYQGQYRDNVLALIDMCGRCEPAHRDNLEQLRQTLVGAGVRHNLRRAKLADQFRRSSRDRKALSLAFAMGWW